MDSVMNQIKYEIRAEASYLVLRHISWRVYGQISDQIRHQVWQQIMGRVMNELS